MNHSTYNMGETLFNGCVYFYEVQQNILPGFRFHVFLQWAGLFTVGYSSREVEDRK